MSRALPSWLSDDGRIALAVAALIAASYLLDGAILGILALGGAVNASVPALYVAWGFGCCAAALVFGTVHVVARVASRRLTLLQVAASVLVQLAFIAYAPSLAMYFIGVLFVIITFAAIALRARDVSALFIVLAIGVVAAFDGVPEEAFVLPHGSGMQRTLVGISVVLMVARCASLGIYATRLRAIFARGYRTATATLAETERVSATAATTIHEELAQELAALALMISSAERRLRQSGGLNPDALSSIETLVRKAIYKARTVSEQLRLPRDQRSAAP